MGIESQIHERAYKNKPLTEIESNKIEDKSKSRACICVDGADNWNVCKDDREEESRNKDRIHEFDLQYEEIHFSEEDKLDRDFNRIDLTKNRKI